MKQTVLNRKTPLRANPDKPLRSKAPLRSSMTPKKAVMAKKPKAETLGQLKAKCDTLCSLIVRKKGNNVCVVCGTTSNPTNGHVFTRTAISTRWDTHEGGDCYVQCRNCNFFHERDRYPYYDWFVTKFGYGAFQELRARHKTVVRFNKTLARETLERLKREWDDVQRA